jgi:phage recombination protein Bet
MVQAGSRRARFPLWFYQIILEVFTYGTYSFRRTRAYFVRFKRTVSGKPFRPERQPCRQHCYAGRTAMQAASPSVPVEITAADGQHFTVSFGDVRNFICPKATDSECKIFLETCKQYKLNPFTKEAYLIHYDNKNDDTASTIVLGKNCYMQMAERNPNFDGFEAGVIVLTADGQLLNREGSIVYDGDGGETLLGGWAKVYRKDRTRASYEEVKLSEYDTGKSLWNGKKATMIRKVALVHALREAFPSTFGALYDECEVRVDAESTAREVSPEELPVLDPYAGSLVPAPDAPSAEENADDPFGGDDA